MKRRTPNRASGFRGVPKKVRKEDPVLMWEPRRRRRERERERHGNNMSEHQGVLTDGAAMLALNLGFYVCSDGGVVERKWINCVEEKDARVLNEMCERNKVAAPYWIPPLPKEPK